MIVSDLVDEWTALANDRIPWEKHWRDIAKYVLPQTEGFDRVLGKNADVAIRSVVSTPAASQKSPELYDMTSLWGIERLAAGLLSLKTPETEYWHGVEMDDPFGVEPTHEEEAAMERLRNFLFKSRSNPRSGFWGAHRPSIKSMCAFGDGWMYVEEKYGGGPGVPVRYEFVPLPEVYPGVGPDGMPDRMFRVFRMSAAQIAKKWPDKCGEKVTAMAADVKQRHDTLRVMHAIRPRSDDRRNFMGVQGARFEMHYCLPDEKHHIGEGGYYEFPFARYAWSNTGTKPFSEGPVACAIAEIKSLQQMSKNELIATQQHILPAYATAGKNFQRLNFNSGAVNPGLISGDGKQLFAPLASGVRPDFARAVIEARRNSVREMLYLNLWQILLEDTQQTATEALIRAQEKGEMLGPVGISLNEGLSSVVDREVSILGRKGAFDDDSPLAMPESMDNKNVAPVFTSPLDRLRKMGELVGMQRLVEFGGMLERLMPGQIAPRFDGDDMLDTAREVLGAPVRSLKPVESAQQARDSQDQMQNTAAALEAIKMGGEAAGAVGQGGAAMAAGAEGAANSPALQKLMDVMPDVINRTSAQQ